jgi:FAD:protein FMN transferase
MTRTSIDQGSFTAMSTTITIGGVDVEPPELEGALVLGRRVAEEWEARFSRFRQDSMLARLNAAEGALTPVDDIFLDLLTTMRDAVFQTEGRFDPAILPALEAAGYTESIERVRETLRTALAPPPTRGVGAWYDVVIDSERLQVALPDAMRLDAGGVAKGAFVDFLVSSFAHWPGGWIDAGGDLRFWGRPPCGEAWTVAIEHPSNPGIDLMTMRIDSPTLAGVATSAPNRRRWLTDSGEVHHLIDPAKGISLQRGPLSVTAFASNATQAEIATKAMMVAASRNESIRPFCSSLAVCVDAGGQITFIQGPVP